MTNLKVHPDELIAMRKLERELRETWGVGSCKVCKKPLDDCQCESDENTPVSDVDELYDLDEI
jgi:hypothetical protein